MPSHSCLMLLQGKINSTSLISSQLEGKYVKGYSTHSRYRRSLEREFKLPEKVTFVSISNLSRFISDNTSALNVVFSSVSCCDPNLMAPRLSIAYKITKKN